jgi:hypothetical protein
MSWEDLPIEVPMSSQECQQSCICVLEVSNLPLSTFFLLDLTVWMFHFSNKLRMF